MPVLVILSLAIYTGDTPHLITERNSEEFGETANQSLYLHLASRFGVLDDLVTRLLFSNYKKRKLISIISN